ncbi:hypothetical protein BC832DRAFT_572734 [Gaertneriomyces semiglobifer]|nr:hypothetical protein BC832DRAFT_572734 [Gaertneriomyces semiglobifer]
MSADTDTLFSKRPDWADVTPIPQDDGPNPLVPIAYAPEYSDAMNYFRAVLSSKERSDRVLKLTEYLVRKNPGHYTVWQYRLETLMELTNDFTAELDFIESMAEDNPKSYQIWHHRQSIIAKTQDSTNEIAFINRALEEDSKNYHAWTYRQWVVSTFSLWDGEIPDVDRLLDDDIRNNSAWNQRYWVFKNRPQGFTDEDLEGEVQYVLERVLIAPRNESPWRYLKGIIKLQNKSLLDFPMVEQTCITLRDRGQALPHGLAMLMDINIERQNFEEARQICATLEDYDPIRQKYWRYRAKQLPQPEPNAHVDDVLRNT